MITISNETKIVVHITTIKSWLEKYEFSPSGLILNRLMREFDITMAKLTEFITNFVYLCNELPTPIPQEVANAIVFLFQFLGPQITSQEMDTIRNSILGTFSQEKLAKVPAQLLALFSQ